MRGDKRVDALRGQLQRGFRRLRFAGELEGEFRADYSDAVRLRRLGLVLSSAALIAVMPLFDRWLLQPPDAMVVAMRELQWLLMMPMLIVAFVTILRRRSPVLAEGVCSLTVLVLGLGVIEQRRLGVELGWAFPSEFVAAIIAGGLVAGGLRFRTQLLIGVGLLGCFVVTELQNRGLAGEVLFHVYAMAVVTLIALIGGYVEQYVARENWLRRMLAVEYTERDALTGLLNHRTFHERYGQLFALAQREQRPIMVAMIDIDDFKAYNDRFGHGQGDACLRQVSDAIRTASRRGTDLVARVGGEEFAVVWYGVGEDRVAWGMERLRERVFDEGLAHPDARTELGAVSVSVGAVWGVPAIGQRADDYLRSADGYLYDSKHAGRNTVTVGLPDGSGRPARPGIRPHLVKG